MAICEPQNTRGPSERLLLQQSMDSSVKKKRKQRDNVKPGEKEALFALREQYSEISLKEFQQQYYPHRSAKHLGVIFKSLREKESGKEEETEKGSEDRRRPSTPRSTTLKRPRKSGPFEYSDSEGEDSSSDERIEDINSSGLRSPNKFIKLSHSADPRSPPNRYEKQRDPRVRSQTHETPQIPNENAASSSTPQTTHQENITASQDTGCLKSSSSSTGMSRIVLDLPSEQPTNCQGAEMQVAIVQDELQHQTQSQALKEEEAFPEYKLKQELAKDSAYMSAKVHSLTQRAEQLQSLVKQLRAKISILEKERDMMQQDNNSLKKEINEMKTAKEVEIAQLNKK